MTTMDFTETNQLQLNVEREAEHGLVLLVAPSQVEEQLQWFTWTVQETSPNVFSRSSSRNLQRDVGDPCPIQEKDDSVMWLSPFAPRLTLWPVSDHKRTEVAVYGCTNRTNVTHIGKVDWTGGVVFQNETTNRAGG